MVTDVGDSQVISSRRDVTSPDELLERNDSSAVEIEGKPIDSETDNFKKLSLSGSTGLSTTSTVPMFRPLEGLIRRSTALHRPPHRQ
jgi:hypothetical protein